MTPSELRTFEHDVPLHATPSRISFRRIVVGIDFSEISKRALRSAIDIAIQFSSHISIVHAASPFMGETSFEAASMDLVNLGLKAARATMDDLVAQHSSLKNIDVDTTIAYADPKELVLRIAHQKDADLIVLGSEGKSGLVRLAVGSVAEAVLSGARCPVLITGPNCNMIGNPFRSILYATDLKPSAIHSADYAASLASQNGSTLTLIHIVSAHDPAGQSLDDRKLIRQTATRELHELLPPTKYPISSFQYRVEFGTACKCISRFAERHKSTLIVAALDSRRTLRNHIPWSTLGCLVRHSPCPVLGVHSQLG